MSGMRPEDLTLNDWMARIRAQKLKPTITNAHRAISSAEGCSDDSTLDPMVAEIQKRRKCLRNASLPRAPSLSMKKCDDALTTKVKMSSEHCRNEISSSGPATDQQSPAFDEDFPLDAIADQSGCPAPSRITAEQDQLAPSSGVIDSSQASRVPHVPSPRISGKTFLAASATEHVDSRISEIAQEDEDF